MMPLVSHFRLNDLTGVWICWYCLGLRCQLSVLCIRWCYGKWECFMAVFNLLSTDCVQIEHTRSMAAC